MAIGFKKEVPHKSEKETVEDLTQEEDQREPEAPVPKAKLLLIIAGAVLILIVVMVIANIINSNKEGSENEIKNNTKKEVVNEVSDTSQQVESKNGIYDENGNTLSQDGINPGAPDYDYSTNNSISERIVSASDYIKDLNGLDVSAVYNVESRDYVTDYIAYKTRRAIISDGMEMYWLEAEYKEKSYRVQVPYFYFKDLGASGICKAEIEVLSLEGGGKIISYMQVVPDEE